MMKWQETIHCTSKRHCKACRTDDAFVESIRKRFEFDGQCPYGFTARKHTGMELEEMDELTPEEAKTMLEDAKQLLGFGGGCASYKEQLANRIKTLEAIVREDQS